MLYILNQQMTSWVYKKLSQAAWLCSGSCQTFCRASCWQMPPTEQSDSSDTLLTTLTILRTNTHFNRFHCVKAFALAQMFYSSHNPHYKAISMRKQQQQVKMTIWHLSSLTAKWKDWGNFCPERCFDRFSYTHKYAWKYFQLHMNSNIHI